MAFFERSARTERELKWARIWFNQFARFHQHCGESDWAFSAEEVIAFSRFHLKNGMPAWKRLKMVQALMNYRRQIQKRPIDDLVPVHSKLQEIVARERAKESGAESIEEVVRREAPKGVNVFWETRRQADFDLAIELMATRGRMILMAGRDARPEFPVGPFYVKECSLHGFVMFKATAVEMRAAADDINHWLAQGKLQANIATTMLVVTEELCTMLVAKMPTRRPIKGFSVTVKKA